MYLLNNRTSERLLLFHKYEISNKSLRSTLSNQNFHFYVKALPNNDNNSIKIN